MSAMGPVSTLSDLGGQVNVTAAMSVSKPRCLLCSPGHSVFFAYRFGVLEKVGHPSLRGRWEAQAVLPHLLPITMETAGGRDGRGSLGKAVGAVSLLPSSLTNSPRKAASHYLSVKLEASSMWCS